MCVIYIVPRKGGGVLQCDRKVQDNSYSAAYVKKLKNAHLKKGGNDYEMILDA